MVVVLLQALQIASRKLVYSKILGSYAGVLYFSVSSEEFLQSLQKLAGNQVEKIRSRAALAQTIACTMNCDRDDCIVCAYMPLFCIEKSSSV